LGRLGEEQQRAAALLRAQLNPEEAVEEAALEDPELLPQGYAESHLMNAPVHPCPNMVVGGGQGLLGGGGST
jgi:hypothetical protein